MAKPSVLPEWASSASAAITEPTLAQKQAGWSVRQRVPAQYLNWWKKTVYQWIQYLDGLASEALTWTAKHTFNAGLATPTAPAAGNDVVNKTYADGLVTALKAAASTWTAKQTVAGLDLSAGNLALIQAAAQALTKSGGKLQVGTSDANDVELVRANSVAMALTTGGIDARAQKLVNLANPTSAQDAATKAYVDGGACDVAFLLSGAGTGTLVSATGGARTLVRTLSSGFGLGTPRGTGVVQAGTMGKLRITEAGNYRVRTYFQFRDPLPGQMTALCGLEFSTTGGGVTSYSQNDVTLPTVGSRLSVEFQPTYVGLAADTEIEPWVGTVESSGSIRLKYTMLAVERVP